MTSATTVSHYMSGRLAQVCFTTLALSALVAPVLASVGDPQIRTDHTYYQGELAYSTLGRLVQSAYTTPGRPATGEPVKDNILKLFLWRIEHYYHGMSPEIWSIPGETPYPPANDLLRIELDSLTAQFSYGWGLCGTNHAQLRPILETAGFGSRRRAIVGDTTHEISYAGRWALFNTDSVSIISEFDSVSAEFAGVNDIISDVDLLIDNPLGLPQYTFGSIVNGPQGDHSQDWYYYYDFGFSLPVAESWAMYGEGFQARPVVYKLKAGEKFTRFGDRDGLPVYLGDPGGYRFWGFVGAGGPFRNWSHVGLAPALPTPPTANARGNSRFGNGIFEWNPDLGAGEHLDGIFSEDSNITFSSESPRLCTTGGNGQVTFHFFSPYVIVARPADLTNPGLPGASGGSWINASVVGSVPVEISTNTGITWQSACSLDAGSTTCDFTDLAKGRHQYLLRLTLSDTDGLDSLNLNTAVQVSEGVWPWLSDNGSMVTYQAGNTGAFEVIPDYTNPTTAEAFKVDDSGNLSFTPLSGSSNYAYTCNDNQPCYLSYRLAAPGGATLQRIHGAADCSVHLPPTGGPYLRLHVSTDGGDSFTQFGEFVPPADDELSHAWVYGTADVAAAGVNEALVRVEFYNGGYISRLRYVRLYGEYMTGSPDGLSITHTWDDSAGPGRSFTHAVAPGTMSDSYVVPTESDTVHRSITLAVTDDPDTDGDGIADSVDNCIQAANPEQRDTDGDSIGNFCDPDVAAPNDCVVNFLDLGVYKANFLQPGELDTDNNGDGQTNFADLNIAKEAFLGRPGPSALGCN